MKKTGVVDQTGVPFDASGAVASQSLALGTAAWIISLHGLASSGDYRFRPLPSHSDPNNKTASKRKKDKRKAQKAARKRNR